MSRNDWAGAIRHWGQVAIDDGTLYLDRHRRASLFDSVIESLRAKENEKETVTADFREQSFKPLVLIPLSGGLDSLIAYERAVEQHADVLAFYVKLNTPYAQDELYALDRLEIEYQVIDHGDWPQRWAPYATRWQHILPLRNLLIIASVAQEVGIRPGEIWLGATEGEIPLSGGDKSLKFFKTVDTILASLPVAHSLEFPLRQETKSDLVAWWISSGRSRRRLLTTITCQAPIDGLACGACHACFNRWIALTNSGLHENLVSDPTGIPANQLKITKFEGVLGQGDFEVWSERRVLQSLSAWYAAKNDPRLHSIMARLGLI